MEKNLLKSFYIQYDIRPIENLKYFGMHEEIEGKYYPRITIEKFINILNGLWKNQMDMNFDYGMDLEYLVELRGQSYMEAVIYFLTYKLPTYAEGTVLNEVRSIIKKEFVNE